MFSVFRKSAHRLAEQGPLSPFISMPRSIVTVLALAVQAAPADEGLAVLKRERDPANITAALTNKSANSRTKGKSIFLWEIASAPAKPNNVSVSATGPGSALFRSVLQNPQYDSESFWAQDLRWTLERKAHTADSASFSLRGGVDTLLDVRLAHWITFPALPLALAPLALAKGLLLLRRKNVQFEIYPD